MIDEKTGLPALPEGFWWDVKAYEISIQTWGRWGAWYPEDYFNRWYDPDQVEKRKAMKPGERWWEKPREVTEVRRRDKLMVFGSGYEGTGRTAPENLLERTQEVLAAWKAEEAARRIYGEYPPNKFTPTEGDAS